MTGMEGLLIAADMILKATKIAEASMPAAQDGNRELNETEMAAVHDRRQQGEGKFDAVFGVAPPDPESANEPVNLQDAAGPGVPTESPFVGEQEGVPDETTDD